MVSSPSALPPPGDGLTLLIGGIDRGKTTCVARWAREMAGGGAVAVIDADTGQSEIGPPGTVGVAFARPDTEKLHDLPLAAAFFVGTLSPAPAALEHVVATVRATRWAQARGARAILIDTPGFVAGPAARRWLAALAQAVEPARIVGLGGDEIDGLLVALAAAAGAPTEKAPTPPGVGRKSTALRATRRLARMARTLESARTLSLPREAVSTLGSTLGTGAPIPPHLARWAGTTLRLPAVRGEIAEGALTLFLAGPPPRPGWESLSGPVAEHFGVRAVRALSLEAYAQVYVGLHDAGGRLLSVGRFLRLDTERDHFEIEAPPPATAERTRVVVFGRIRVAADGAVRGELRPGEI